MKNYYERNSSSKGYKRTRLGKMHKVVMFVCQDIAGSASEVELKSHIQFDGITGEEIQETLIRASDLISEQLSMGWGSC